MNRRSLFRALVAAPLAAVAAKVGLSRDYGSDVSWLSESDIKRGWRCSFSARWMSGQCGTCGSFQWTNPVPDFPTIRECSTCRSVRNEEDGKMTNFGADDAPKFEQLEMAKAQAVVVSGGVGNFNSAESAWYTANELQTPQAKT